MCVIKFGCFWCGIASMLWSIWINLWNIFGFMMFCSICLSVASGILQVWLYPNEKRIWLIFWILAGCWWLLGSIWSWNVWIMGTGPKEQYRGTCTCTEISFVFKISYQEWFMRASTNSNCTILYHHCCCHDHDHDHHHYRGQIQDILQEGMHP